MKQLYRKISKEKRRELQMKIFNSIKRSIYKTFRETPEEMVMNTYLQILNIFRYVFRYKPKNFRHTARNYYRNLSFIDKFKNLDNWNRNLWWGQYNEDEEVAYMDTSMAKITDNGLSLSYKKHKKINSYSGRTMDWKIGTVESKQTFGYGAYEVICQINPSEGIWFAPLWMVSKGDGSKEKFKVLPEPDVCEFYTNGNINKYKAQTNFHYGKSYEKEDHRTVGARTHLIRNVYNRNVSFGLIWTNQFVDFYYDGYRVRRITNKKVLDNMNDLMVVMGSGVKKGTDVKYVKEGGNLLIKRFNYWN